MLITVSYFAQAAVATGCSEEAFEAPTLGALLNKIQERHGDRVHELICDADGNLVPWILVDLNGEAIRSAEQNLKEGDHVRFLSPISGG